VACWGFGGSGAAPTLREPSASTRRLDHTTFPYVYLDATYVAEQSRPYRSLLLLIRGRGDL
jgi:hypothetical protein